jgi:hypothetical protein
VLQPLPPQVLTLQHLAPETVQQTLEALLHGTFVFDSSQVPCTVVHGTVT